MTFYYDFKAKVSQKACDGYQQLGHLFNQGEMLNLRHDLRQTCDTPAAGFR